MIETPAPRTAGNFQYVQVLMKNEAAIVLDPGKEILAQARRSLASDGYLALGGPETTVMRDPAFEPTNVGKATFFQLRRTS